MELNLVSYNSGSVENNLLDMGLNVISANCYLAVAHDIQTGNLLNLSTSQGVSGWPLPNTNQNLIDLAALIIRGVTNGEYELIDNFKNAETPINIKHNTCRNIHKWKFRNFVYEEVRCSCESRITFEEAKARIEGSGEFELIEFHRGNYPVCIRHKLCGKILTISYHKFIQRPWCKVCTPRTRNAEYFKQQVQDLVGSEYEVIGDYVDSHTPILILHNSGRCQRASGAKDIGEFYTPYSVVRLIVELIEPFEGTVYEIKVQSLIQFSDSLAA